MERMAMQSKWKRLADLPAYAKMIWIGNYGEYPIPRTFNDIRLTKHGDMDRRFSRYRQLETFMLELDKANAE
jgi:hypothetical protein